MKPLKVAAIAALATGGQAMAASLIDYTLELGGNPNAASYEAGQFPQYQAGTTGLQTFSTSPVNWDARVTVSGTHEGGPVAANVLPNGAANLVFNLELRSGSTNGPLVQVGHAGMACGAGGPIGKPGNTCTNAAPTSAGFYSVINDGDRDGFRGNLQGNDELRNASFAISFDVDADPEVGAVEWGRLIDDATAVSGSDFRGGPGMGYANYPSAAGLAGGPANTGGGPNANTTAPLGVLVGMGAGYTQFVPSGCPDFCSANGNVAGVGMATVGTSGWTGLGNPPMFEGQINMNGLASGTYCLVLVPGEGNNILHGDFDPEFDSAASIGNFASKADSTDGDSICFVWEGGPVVTPITPTNWRSIRSHAAGVGNQAIALGATRVGNGTNGPTVESRNGGIREIQVDLGSAQTSVTGTVSAIDLSDNSTIAASAVNLINGGTTLQILFNANVLPNQKCYRIDLSSNFTLAGGADGDVNVRALIGDANGDGQVSLIDFQLAKSRIGQAVAPTNIRNDVNLDGAMSLIDAQLIKSRIGQAVTCP